jgi:hypothetical protein
MFVLLLEAGLAGCIGLSLFEPMGPMGLPISIIAPSFLTLPIFNTKKYKRIVFKDEKSQQKNNNILLVSLLLFGYVTSIVLCYELSDYYDFVKYSGIWILITNIVYFLSVLYLFIEKISGNKEERIRRSRRMGAGNSPLERESSHYGGKRNTKGNAGVLSSPDIWQLGKNDLER